MTRPVRIQLSRKKGWRMPPNTVKVTRPGKWGNPFRIGEPGIPDAAAAVEAFRDLVAPHPPHVIPLYMSRAAIVAELRDKNLACWCKPGEPCHADVLLELANGGTA